MKKSVVSFAGSMGPMEKKPSRETEGRKSMVQFAGGTPSHTLEKKSSTNSAAGRKSTVQFAGGEPLEAVEKQSTVDASGRKSTVQFAGELSSEAIEKKASTESSGSRKSTVQIAGEPPSCSLQKNSSTDSMGIRKSMVQFAEEPPANYVEKKSSSEAPVRQSRAKSILHLPRSLDKRQTSEADGRKSRVSFAASRLSNGTESEAGGSLEISRSFGVEGNRLTKQSLNSEFAVLRQSSIISGLPGDIGGAALTEEEKLAMTKLPSRDLIIRVIQAELQSRRVDTEKTVASKLFGRGSSFEAWIFEHAAKSQRSVRVLWLMWLTGASLGMLAMSDVLPRAVIAASVLMLPLPCLTSMVLLTDLMLQVAYLFESYLMTGMQCYLIGSAALLLKDERVIFWACLAPTFLMATFVDAYPSKFRPLFAKLFFLGSGAVLMAWVLILFFGWLHPLNDNEWQLGQLQGSTVYSIVQNAGTLLAFCGSYLYSAFLTPDSFVVIKSSVSTERIWVRVEKEEVDGELLPTGKLIRCDKRSTRLDLAPEEIGLTQHTSMATGWRSQGPRSFRKTEGRKTRRTGLIEEDDPVHDPDSTLAAATSSRELADARGAVVTQRPSMDSVPEEDEQEAETPPEKKKTVSTDESQTASRLGRAYNALRQSCLSQHDDPSRDTHGIPASPLRSSAMGSLTGIRLPFYITKARQPLSDPPAQRATEYI